MRFLQIKNNPDILKSYKSRDTVTIECDWCDKHFSKAKNEIQSIISKKYKSGTLFCSKSCSGKFGVRIRNQGSTTVECAYCNLKFTKNNSQLRSKNNFCNSSCSASYGNRNKSHGTRRSKLEKFIESELITTFPTLPILFNNKSVIGSELDIYFPTLNLAIELNGVFHYKPIFGIEKFNSIQSNDDYKKVRCKEQSVDLVVIDTSSQNYFSKKSSEIFLKLIYDAVSVRFGRIAR